MIILVLGCGGAGLVISLRLKHGLPVDCNRTLPQTGKLLDLPEEDTGFPGNIRCSMPEDQGKE